MQLLKWMNVKENPIPLKKWVLVFDPTMEFHPEDGEPLYFNLVLRLKGDLFICQAGNQMTWKGITHWMSLPLLPSAINFGPSPGDP